MPDILFLTRPELEIFTGEDEVYALSSDDYGGPIIVIGWSYNGWGSGGGGGGGGGNGWDTNQNDMSHGGDSGSSDPNYAQTLNHFETCATDDGAAVQIADKIMQTNSVYGPTLYNWTQHEYAALVVKNSDGTYGAMDATVFTKGLTTNSSVPRPDPDEFAVGLIHNHPNAIGDDDEDLRQRYPSTRDWESLETLKGIYEGSNPGYDPSLWLLDRWGVLREFKLADRTFLDGLDDVQLRAGVGLEGRERSASCSAG